MKTFCARRRSEKLPTSDPSLPPPAQPPSPCTVAVPTASPSGEESEFLFHFCFLSSMFTQTAYSSHPDVTSLWDLGTSLVPSSLHVSLRCHEWAVRHVSEQRPGQDGEALPGPAPALCPHCLLPPRMRVVLVTGD